jgi:ribonuclease-3
MLRFLKKLFGLKQPTKPDRSLSLATRRKLESRLGYQFQRPHLLLEALTHRSFHGGSRTTEYPAYERLEFLGDSVLGLVVAERLFLDYPDMPEGELTKSKSLLVNRKALAHAAKPIGLGDYILMSEDEEKAGGRRRQSILADCLEAIIGAVYEDGGMRSAREVVSRLITFDFDQTLKDLSLRNYKGELLELLQSHAWETPRYVVAAESGPDHHKSFTVEVYINGRVLGSGVGDSKKSAEQRAAQQALTQWKRDRIKEME